MKHLILLTVLIMPSFVSAEPASNMVWMPETLDFVEAGNIKKGEQLAEPCIGCHGEKGISPAGMFPSLAGQTANYTYKQLRDYADGKRDNVMMSSVAQGLSEQDSADLAVWFQSLPAAQNKASKQDLSKAEVLVDQGNGKKILPPCFTCHGADGKGQRMDIPALAGQQAEYTINTLLEYKNGTRHNDIYSRMRLIARQLSDDEIKQLGELYQQMK
ncbi:cytochrome c4 [Methylococcaceae bacterium CS5]|uniref:c-type cytochrome n=1 Tax=Bathymodiolus platifrons methanotrophic gill symbiont TaxID=113268 RepID=UPI000B40721E|nr:c-type cytochrome [Bathymodiolus platifrons methanotrophic gill symbiont]MCK5870159.1 cytochrome c4 [Methyloprofundus sp.]TXK97625.1 cytochrome c4 [Methylococcaceae bacterium CS5]TXL05380.1 cytochrome c4 [Methylococcaceae bacterium CS3]TXL09617.1 cytochrome c4 [Methylococcaceae bacterium CS2]